MVDRKITSNMFIPLREGEGDSKGKCSLNKSTSGVKLK